MLSSLKGVGEKLTRSVASVDHFTRVFSLIYDFG